MGRAAGRSSGTDIFSIMRAGRTPGVLTKKKEDDTMATRNFAGFRTSWMEGDPQYEPVEIPDGKPAEPAPEQLLELRKKITQLTIFMSTPAFAELSQEEKLDIITDYAELNGIEHGYSELWKELNELRCAPSE